MTGNRLRKLVFKQYFAILGSLQSVILQFYNLKVNQCVTGIYTMSYQFLLMQCDYHFVSTIDRHDVISGFVVAVVAKSIQGRIRGRGALGTGDFERRFC